MQQFEGYFLSHDEQSLFYQIWQQSEKPDQCKGWIVVTHGQGEHSDCYRRLVNAILPKGFNIIGWDLRGHGRSDGKRGYAKQFKLYLDDFYEFHKQVITPLTAFQNRFWISHSMGGLIQLLGLLRVVNGTKEKQILSNPYLGLSMPVPIFKEIGAIILQNYLPKLTLGNEIKNEDLTRDPAVLKEYNQDTLRHHKISSGVYVGAKEAQEEAFARATHFEGPLFIQIAEHDPIVSSPRVQSFFELLKMNPKKLKIYSERKHEIYNDLGRDEVFHDLINWLIEFS